MIGSEVQRTSVGESTHDYAFFRLGSMPSTAPTGEETALRELCHYFVDTLPPEELRDIFADAIDDAEMKARQLVPSSEQRPITLFEMTLGVEQAPAFSLDEL